MGEARSRNGRDAAAVHPCASRYFPVTSSSPELQGVMAPGGWGERVNVAHSIRHDPPTERRAQSLNAQI